MSGDKLTADGLMNLMDWAWGTAKTMHVAQQLRQPDAPTPVAFHADGRAWVMRTGEPLPRPLGSVALPLEGDHDEAEWDMRPVVGAPRDCDGLLVAVQALGGSWRSLGPRVETDGWAVERSILGYRAERVEPFRVGPIRATVAEALSAVGWPG